MEGRRRVKALPGESLFFPRDFFYLISDTTDTFSTPDQFELKKGASLLYDAQWYTNGTGLAVEILSTGRSGDWTQGYNDGRLGGLLLARQGADLLVDTGISNAVAERRERSECLPVVFAAVGGGHSRYDTGSHLDIDGISMLTGMAELGVVLKGGSESRMHIDGGVQGYVGKRWGVTGSVWFKYEF